MTTNPLRRQVLSLYKRILRISRTWNAANPERTKEERAYIVDEARTRFRQNSNLNITQLVEEHIREGEARLEMGLHYKNPHPRPVNLPPKSLTRREGTKLGKFQEKLKQQSRPVYIKSIDN